MPMAAMETEAAGNFSEQPRSGLSPQSSGSALIQFTQQNPVQALMISALMGMLLGFVLGSRR